MNNNFLEEKILNQSTAIRPKVLPEIESLIQSTTFPANDIIKYTTSIKEWLKPIIDLSNYYVYPTNGITEGLNWWYYQESRSVSVDIGEYQWITPTAFSNKKINYISIPSAINGNYREYNSSIPCVLDLAYVGSTKIKKIELHNNVEYLFFSLSKSFGLRNLRTGWVFTSIPDKKLESLIYSAKYFNYYAHVISEKIISNYDIDFIYNKFHKQQEKFCNILNLNPSDSVWLASTSDQKYQKFFRNKGCARINLSEVYQYE